MARKFMALTLMTALILLLAACGGSAPAKPAEDKNKVYTIRMADPYAKDTILTAQCEWWGKELEKRSKGRLKVEVFHSSQLMPSDQHISALMDGRIQADMSHTSSLAALEPSCAIWALPYLFGGAESFDPDNDNYKVIDNCQKFLEDPVFKKIVTDNLEKKGLKSYPTMADGPRYITSTKKKYLSLDDIKGQKIRVPGGIWAEEICKQFGFSAVAMPVAEVPTALMQGTLDGALLVPIYTNQTKTPVKYFSNIPFDHSLIVTIDMSVAFYKSLPADLQKIIDEVSAELLPYSCKLVKDELKVAYQGMKDMGIEIVDADDAVVRQAREMCNPVFEAFGKKVPGGKELLDRAFEISYGKK